MNGCECVWFFFEIKIEFTVNLDNKPARNTIRRIELPTVGRRTQIIYLPDVFYFEAFILVWTEYKTNKFCYAKTDMPMVADMCRYRLIPAGITGRRCFQDVASPSCCSVNMIGSAQTQFGRSKFSDRPKDYQRYHCCCQTHMICRYCILAGPTGRHDYPW